MLATPVYTLGEIAATGRKAARGAGLDWGHAEEAGAGAAWLAAHGAPGPEALAGWLCRSDGWDHARRRPADPALAEWRAARGTALCPLVAGAALSDRAALLPPVAELTLVELGAPVLLVPFLAWIARDTGRTLRLGWDGGALVLGPGGPQAHPGWPGAGGATAGRARAAAAADAGRDANPCCGAADPDLLARPMTVTVVAAGACGPPEPRRTTGRSVRPAVWETLERFAARTLVAASERSRRGAGGTAAGPEPD